MLSKPTIILFCIKYCEYIKHNLSYKHINHRIIINSRDQKKIWCTKMLFEIYLSKFIYI